MKLHGNQAFANFLATAATVASTNQFFVSARIGGESKESTTSKHHQQEHQRRAPLRQGYDPTVAPGVAGISSSSSSSIESQPTLQTPPRRSSSSSYMNDHHFDRPGSKSIDDYLKIHVHPIIVGEIDNRLRNATTATTRTNLTSSHISSPTNTDNTSQPNDNGCFNHPDTGVLICPTPIQSPSGTPTEKLPKTTVTTNSTALTTKETSIPVVPSNNVETTGGDGGCRIGYYGNYGTITIPVPAADYLHDHVSKDAPEGFGITFDPIANTVYCHQDYDLEARDYSCAFLTFQGCNVHCTGHKSCVEAVMEDATTIACVGIESCESAHLDADVSIVCGAKGACYSSQIGVHQLVQTLDCQSESSCELATVSHVDDVLCSGPLACFRAQLSGVESKVTCQSNNHHPEGFYSLTCGGEGAFIEAADDYNILVVCNGDFACIGYGHDAYDQSKEHPIYFDIDVGKKGELICENSLAGNHDGGTYVCRYVDIIQGCEQYECYEPMGFTEDNDYRTCNHIFSLHHHELCYEGKRRSDFTVDVDVDVAIL